MLNEEKRNRGTSYKRLAIEYKTYTNPPAMITPVELIHWALDYGGWSRELSPYKGTYVWVGPARDYHLGISLPPVEDMNEALEQMREAYEEWWEERQLMKAAMTSLQAMGHEVEEEEEEEEEEDEGWSGDFDW